MNYILLSGGSGKRLWPLSNEVRSKQFIKILKKNDCTYESMVQRVFRQINNVDSNANITIATSSAQVPTLKNQLGNNIKISVEPCRRDTFPAIVLACMHLKDIQNIDINETVIISPVDPYVDDDYFNCLKVLDNKMKSSKNNIGLIGIKPTYPSEKYGYIVTKDQIVERFVEKPNQLEAKKLIGAGALWNGGVFCFKLKYIIDRAKKIIDFKDYNDLYGKFETLTKISFDYAIVEKETNIDVVKYDGEWKDIGTWNTLTEVMTDSTIGNVLFDAKSDNINFINELDIPILGMGLKNIVVAASPDGIFVSDKNESSYNKPLVEKLESRPMYEERAWGNYKILEMYSQSSINGDYNKSLVKHIYIEAGKSISYQLHNHRKEVWVIVEGKGKLIIDDDLKEVNAGDTIIIEIGQKHKITAVNKLHFIEVQLGKELSEEDIQRFD